MRQFLAEKYFHPIFSDNSLFREGVFKRTGIRTMTAARQHRNLTGFSLKFNHLRR